MSRLKVCGRVCYNLIYDEQAIIQAVEYLEENNPDARVTYKDIYDNMISHAEKNAIFAVEYRDKDGAFPWSGYMETGGYLIVFSLIEYTKNHGFPVIQANIYVSPNIGHYNHQELKIRPV